MLSIGVRYRRYRHPRALRARASGPSAISRRRGTQDVGRFRGQERALRDHSMSRRVARPGKAMRRPRSVPRRIALAAPRVEQGDAAFSTARASRRLGAVQAGSLHVSSERPKLSYHRTAHFGVLELNLRSIEPLVTILLLLVHPKCARAKRREQCRTAFNVLGLTRLGDAQSVRASVVLSGIVRGERRFAPGSASIASKLAANVTTTGGS